MNDDYPSWVNTFLSTLEATGLMHTAAVAAGTTMRKINSMRSENSEFDYAVTHSEQIANDVLEREARRRAIEGIEKGVYYQGELVDTETQYSDGLLTTLLKAKRPDEFAERKQISGPGGSPLTVVVRTFTDQVPTLTGVAIPALQPPSLAEILDMV